MVSGNQRTLELSLAYELLRVVRSFDIYLDHRVSRCVFWIRLAGWAFVQECECRNGTLWTFYFDSLSLDFICWSLVYPEPLLMYYILSS